MTDKKNLIKISSTNCRGLGDYSKRMDVFNFLRFKKYGIYCLQDTHFTKNIEPYIKAEWGGEIVFNSYTSNSRGVCILFNNNIEYKIHRSKTDQEGNLLVLDIEVESQRLSLVNIYGPNDDTPEFYQNMYDVIEEFANENIIICGDFNLVQNQDLDTHNYVNINNPRAKSKLQDINDELSLVDPYREKYNELKRFTWRKTNPIKQARLDFFLITETLMHSLNDIEILPSYRSDHSSVVLSLEINDFIKGRGLWKFNVSLLKDKMYVNTVKKCINDTKEQYMLPVYSKEFIEDNINNDMIQFTISHQLFLENLYKNHDVNENQDNEIISILEHIEQNPKLSFESRNKLEGELTEKEILAALKKMKNNKSPGMDGFTSEFFKFFYNDIKVFIK